MQILTTIFYVLLTNSFVDSFHILKVNRSPSESVSSLSSHGTSIPERRRARRDIRNLGTETTSTENNMSVISNVQANKEALIYPIDSCEGMELITGDHVRFLGFGDLFPKANNLSEIFDTNSEFRYWFV